MAEIGRTGRASSHSDRSASGGFAGEIVPPLCPSCGYELTGLGLGAVRCPEWGEATKLPQDQATPLRLQATFNKLETPLVTCVALFLLGVPCLPLLIRIPPLDEHNVTLIGLFWMGAALRYGALYEWRAGWMATLLQFHVAGLLGATGVILTISVANFSIMAMTSGKLQLRGAPVHLWPHIALGWFTCGLFWALFLWSYRTAKFSQKRLHLRRAIRLIHRGSAHSVSDGASRSDASND